MGTNYYALEAACPAPCKHCEQTEWHICKSLTMFAAHETTPWGRVESWADWKRVLLQHDAIVRDEYGTRHDTSDFIRDVEATAPDQRRRQFQWLVDHSVPLDRDYLDADGFSFHQGEFS